MKNQLQKKVLYYTTLNRYKKKRVQRKKFSFKINSFLIHNQNNFSFFINNKFRNYIYLNKKNVKDLVILEPISFSFLYKILVS